MPRLPEIANNPWVVCVAMSSLKGLKDMHAKFLEEEVKRERRGDGMQAARLHATDDVQPATAHMASSSLSVPASSTGRPRWWSTPEEPLRQRSRVGRQVSRPATRRPPPR